MRARSIFWWMDRVAALLSRPPIAGVDDRGVPVQQASTRLGLLLDPYLAS